MDSATAPSPQRLRIAVVIDVYDEASGGGIVSTRRFTALLRRRHDVVVVSTGQPAPGKVVLPGFYVPFARRLMDGMRFVFAWPRGDVLAQALAGADIVHVQLPLLLGIRAVALARRMGLPVLATFHLQPENLLYNLGIRSRLLAGLLHRCFIRCVYNRCAAVICPTAFAESELRRFGLAVPTHVVSNGVLPRFRPVVHHREPDLAGRFVVLSVGRLARDKRHDVLIEAVLASRHRDRIQLVLAGRGPLQQEVERRAARLPVPPRIGYVSDDALIRWLNLADLYVHPSEVELEGMAVLEAMACGLPVLVADAATSAARHFAISEHFLFRANDPVHLASRIDHWIEHPRELAAARRVYLEKASHYRIEESVRRLEAIYSRYAPARRR